MSRRKPRLELTWIGKNEHPQLEPRILLEDDNISYHAEARFTNYDIFDNILIHGDNLLALKALEQEYSGKIKCIYIDPPYNTGNAFDHYDDSLEHSIWLSLMRDRLELLWRLQHKSGFICCHIDDSEGHYLKVLMDEIWGRDNYLTTLYIQVRYPAKTLKQDMDFHKEIEQIHVYRKDYGARPSLNIISNSFDKFVYYIRETGKGKLIELGGKKVKIFSPDEYEIIKGESGPDGLKEIWATGAILDGNSSGRFFRDYLQGRVQKDGLGALYKVEGIGDDKFGHRYFTGPKRENATKGKYYQGVPNELLKNPDMQKLSPIENFYDLSGAFGNCRHEGGVEFRSGKKPERLLEIILRHFSHPGDLVLDSFAGSGTTGAVAHKMRRRWIMVELGNHCETHIVPRLRKVIDGSDTGGVTEAVDWHGGGGFRYYNLAPSFLEKDAWGNWVISKEYDAPKIAQAVCKLMGFIYQPDDTHYWMHGSSSETDFIYVTTQNLTYEQLAVLAEEVGDQRTLLVCCKAFHTKSDAFPNLTIRKIPQSVLRECEWGKDDYSLNVASLPETYQKSNVADTSATMAKSRKRRGDKIASTNDLFNGETSE